MLGQIYFYVLAALALAGAVVTVSQRNPIRGAMGLLLTVLSIAGLFLALNAEFLAFIQLIVYAGALVVLFIFVIMLLGSSATSDRDHRGQLPRTLGAVVFGGIASLAYWLLHGATKTRAFDTAANDFGSIEGMGRLLFTKGLAPFELLSALLMVAIVGAVAVARGRTSADTHLGAGASPDLPPRSTEGASEGKG
jgi:NADH-quinone oxidoreductase subunit J